MSACRYNARAPFRHPERAVACVSMPRTGGRGTWRQAQRLLCASAACVHLFGRPLQFDKPVQRSMEPRCSHARSLACQHGSVRLCALHHGQDVYTGHRRLTAGTARQRVRAAACCPAVELRPSLGIACQGCYFVIRRGGCMLSMASCACLRHHQHCRLTSFAPRLDVFVISTVPGDAACK
jgi:hypothetical protein